MNLCISCTCYACTLPGCFNNTQREVHPLRHPALEWAQSLRGRPQRPNSDTSSLSASRASNLRYTTNPRRYVFCVCHVVSACVQYLVRVSVCVSLMSDHRGFAEVHPAAFGTVLAVSAVGSCIPQLSENAHRLDKTAVILPIEKHPIEALRHLQQLVLCLYLN